MIDFLKYRGIAAAISLSIIGAFIGTYIYRVQRGEEALKFSVDFTGGTQIRFKFDKPVTSTDLKLILANTEWPNANVLEFPPSEALVRVQAFSSDAQGLAVKMKDAIEKERPGLKAEILQSESVGSTIGEALRMRSLKAILLALLAMLIYIVLRFRSIGFALGAVVALFHDALIILASFMFFGKEISVNVIMAILAILGYSINDTIVIFTQIRKNIKHMHGDSLRNIVNTSINQMLRRTLLTSISTGLTVGALYFLGGEILHNLSFALLVGIIFGTYSSIYIASPVMMLFYKEKTNKVTH